MANNFSINSGESSEPSSFKQLKTYIYSLFHRIFASARKKKHPEHSPIQLDYVRAKWRVNDAKCAERHILMKPNGPRGSGNWGLFLQAAAVIAGLASRVDELCALLLHFLLARPRSVTPFFDWPWMRRWFWRVAGRRGAEWMAITTPRHGYKNGKWKNRDIDAPRRAEG